MNANSAWDIKVITLANVMKVTFLPVLSIMNPKIGEAAAENKYGIPKNNNSQCQNYSKFVRRGICLNTYVVFEQNNVYY